MMPDAFIIIAITYISYSIQYCSFILAFAISATAFIIGFGPQVYIAPIFLSEIKFLKTSVTNPLSPRLPSSVVINKFFVVLTKKKFYVEKRKRNFEPARGRTWNLLIRSQTRFHCATSP